MPAGWHRMEHPVRRVLRWSAGRVSAARREEIASAAWLACEAAGRRHGTVAFAKAVVAEMSDQVSMPLRVRLGRAPRVTNVSTPSSFRGPSMRIVHDVARASRRLRSGKGTLALAIGMLALAIGVTTAMFTVLDALMLHPVPFRDASRLTSVVITDGPRFLTSSPAPALRAWRGAAGFSRVEGAMQAPVTLETPSGLMTKGAARITPGLTEMLGVQPILGRAFAADEGRAGTDDRILLGEELWVSLYNRDPGIVGRRVRVSGVPVEVVGVMPAAFRFPNANSQAWQPIDFDAPPPSLARARPRVYARLKPGVPEADALRLADAALKAGVPLEPDQRTGFRPIAAGMVDAYSKRAVTALAIGVGLVFLVLCANAMNLLLTRLSSREREFGVCSALGASRARLLGEALIETALIGVAAAAAGLALATWLVATANASLPAAFLSRTLTPVAISWRAIAATSLLGVLAVAIAGLTPAWMGTKVDASDALRGTARGGTAARSHRRLARGLLVAEVAFAAALLAGAAQLVRTFVNLVRADRGLNGEGVIGGWISLPDFAYRDRAGRIAFASSLEERLRALPGVTAVSMSAGLPPSTGTIYFGGVRSDVPGAAELDDEINLYQVTPRFFSLFEIAFVEGGTFPEPAVPTDVILGERLARRLWPDGPAVGRTLTMGGNVPYRVIGVVREIRNALLDPRLDPPEMYQPLVVERDGRVEAAAFGSGQISIALRAGASGPSLEAISTAIRDVSANAEIVTLGPMEDAYLKDLARPRAAAALGAVFAVVALLASAGGLFGVLNAAVARRRREFGIRVALGIEPRRLTRLVLRDAVGLAAAGLLVGVLGAWMLSRALVSLTYGVTAADPLSWAAVFGTLAVSVLLAAWRPCVHAARVSPSELLRTE